MNIIKCIFIDSFFLDVYLKIFFKNHKLWHISWPFKSEKNLYKTRGQLIQQGYNPNPYHKMVNQW